MQSITWQAVKTCRNLKIAPNFFFSNNVFRHVETLFIQGNQVRTESKQTSFLLPKEEVCFDSVRTCLPWTNKVSTCRNALLFAPYPKPKVENYSGAN